MRPRQGSFAFLIAGALIALCCVSPASAHVLTPSTSAKATPILQRIVKLLVREGAPGALAEVRTRTRVRRAAAGVSQRQPRVALRARDRFRAASITKSFVATVVLELAAEGKLSLDDNIEHWLPSLVPNGATITLRELLNHTSGLFNYSEGAEWVETVLADPKRIWVPKELIALSAAHTPYFTAGTDWHYANTNYVLLGLVIEAATGRSVGDELRDRIFQPLGLGETSFPTGVDASGLVHAYVGEATLPGVHRTVGHYARPQSLVVVGSRRARLERRRRDDVLRAAAVGTRPPVRSGYSDANRHAARKELWPRADAVRHALRTRIRP